MILILPLLPIPEPFSSLDPKTSNGEEWRSPPPLGPFLTRNDVPSFPLVCSFFFAWKKPPAGFFSLFSLRLSSLQSSCVHPCLKGPFRDFIVLWVQFLLCFWFFYFFHFRDEGGWPLFSLHCFYSFPFYVHKKKMGLFLFFLPHQLCNYGILLFSFPGDCSVFFSCPAELPALSDPCFFSFFFSKSQGSFCSNRPSLFQKIWLLFSLFPHPTHVHWMTFFSFFFNIWSTAPSLLCD